MSSLTHSDMWSSLSVVCLSVGYTLLSAGFC